MNGSARQERSKAALMIPWLAYVDAIHVRINEYHLQPCITGSKVSAISAGDRRKFAAAPARLIPSGISHVYECELFTPGLLIRSSGPMCHDPNCLAVSFVVRSRIEENEIRGLRRKVHSSRWNYYSRWAKVIHSEFLLLRSS